MPSECELICPQPRSSWASTATPSASCRASRRHWHACTASSTPPACHCPRRTTRPATFRTYLCAPPAHHCHTPGLACLLTMRSPLGPLPRKVRYQAGREARRLLARGRHQSRVFPPLRPGRYAADHARQDGRAAGKRLPAHRWQRHRRRPAGRAECQCQAAPRVPDQRTGLDQARRHVRRLRLAL